jgi:hypothetical protein
MTRKLLGIPIRKILSRSAVAVGYGFVTLFVFYEIPNLLLKNLPASDLGNLPIGNSELFLYYGILITALSTVQIIFEKSFLGDAAAVSNGVAQIVYIYIVSNGGFFSDYISSAGIFLSIDYRTILYLMMIPSALSIISTVISASTRVSMKNSEMLEEVVLA